MHPDQMYELRQLRHSDLRMESEQARVRRELTSRRAARGSDRLMVWLRRSIVGQLREITVGR